MGQEERQRKGCNRTRNDPNELQYERHLMIGGYENPVQTMPSGEGNFYFETSDPGAIDSFYAPDADRLLSRYPEKDADGADIPGGKYHLDLRAANLMTLLRAGIPEDHIAVSNVCTMCNADTFYSYRAHRLENEQVAMLVNRFCPE